MSKYLLYKPNKNCAEMPNGCQNIKVSLGDPFLAHTVYIYMHVYTGCAKKASPSDTEIF